MKKVQTLFVVVVVVWRLGGKKEEGLLFFVEKEAKNEKKNEKSLSFFGFTFSSRGQHKKKKKAISSLPNCFSPGPSVVEEEEDLEDLHHHGDV